jgi:hypothetical protein
VKYLVVGIALCAALIACSGGTTNTTPTTATQAQHVHGNVGTPPPVGWQFLNPDPITTPLCVTSSNNCNPTRDPDSDSEVAEIYTTCGSACPTSSPLNIGEVQEAQGDYSSPNAADTDAIYFATSSDPKVTVECPTTVTEDHCYGTLPINNIRIPVGATGSADSDHHATVFYKNVEYDLWKFTSVVQSNSTIVYARGADTCDVGSYSDMGTCSGTANAAGIAQQAGQLDPREWINGAIDHAIYVSIPCPSGSFSWPADYSDGQCSSGPEDGERIWLDFSDSHINQLVSQGGIAPWEATLLHAWHDYGFVVVDTSGCGAPWNFYGVDNQTFTIVGDTTDGWTAFWAYLMSEGVTNFYFSKDTSHLPIPNQNPRSGAEQIVSQSNIHIVYQPGVGSADRHRGLRATPAGRMHHHATSCST